MSLWTRDINTNIHINMHTNQPAGGKNNPVSPAFPLFKHKKRQRHWSTAVGSQCWLKRESGKRTLEKYNNIEQAYTPTCRWRGSTSRCDTPTAQIERKAEPLRHWHGLLLLYQVKDSHGSVTDHKHFWNYCFSYTNIIAVVTQLLPYIYLFALALHIISVTTASFIFIWCICMFLDSQSQIVLTEDVEYICIISNKCNHLESKHKR